MTKAQLQSNYKIKEMVELPAFMAVLVYLSTNTDDEPGNRDATTIINQEGVLRGRQQILEKLRGIAVQDVTPEKAKVIQPYSEPAVSASKPETKK